MDLHNDPRFRTAYLNPRHFAEAAVFHIAASGASLNANVIPDLEFQEVDIGAGAPIEARQHRITAAAKDLPSLAENDTVRLRDPVTDQQALWRIRTIRPDAFGMLTIELQATS